MATLESAQSISVTERLMAIYEAAGFRVHTGWNPYHMDNWRDASFTYLEKDGRPLNTGGGGVGLHEIPCFELLSLCVAPQRILVIGNSFGWSTLLVSLLWPNAEVAAMDIGVQPPGDPAQKLLESIISKLRGDKPPLNPKPTYGIDLTNELAETHGLKARAILSCSPKDISWVAEKHLKGPPDFVFIDGYHIPPQVLLDFEGSSKASANNCVYLFHDVINWDLREAFEICRKNSGLSGGILWRTPSGMGLLFPRTQNALDRVVHVFGGDEGEMLQVKSKLPRWKRAAWFQRTVLHNPFLKRVKDAVIKPKSA